MFVLLLEGFFFSLLLIVPLMQQPLSLGFAVMVMSLVLSGFLGMSFFSWYGFILFLVYVGGLLVLFSYVIVLMPNFVFSILGPLSLFFFVFFSFVVFGGFIFYSGAYFLEVEEGLDSSFFFFCDSGVVFVFVGFVLLVALIVVVKICYFYWGALRPFVV